MNISFENALGAHPTALALRSARTQIIASNIANADTPNFKARDISFDAALKSAMSESGNTHMRRTNERHIGTFGASGGTELLYRVPMMASVDGNTVDGHTEQSEFAANTLQFQAALRFLNGKFSGLRSAIRGE